MSQMTDAFENWVLNQAFGKTPGFTLGTQFWIALWKGDPTDAGTGATECSSGTSYGAYARVTLPALMGTATSGYINNITDIVFPQAIANWGDITHIAVMSSATGGTMIVFASLAATVTINNNEQFRINASNLTFQAL